MKQQERFGKRFVTFSSQFFFFFLTFVQKNRDFAFKLVYTVTLRTGDLLECDLTVHNQDKKSFPFTTALHTYFSVPSAPHASVGPGFKGLEYIGIFPY
jgi:D-hexose-6-phosphate mutarotase